MDSEAPPPLPGEQGEFQAIARWLSILRTTSPEVLVGPGDDAAWLAVDAPLSVSVDRVEEGVHFERGWCRPDELGWKALGSALSDLAATRARPVGFLLTLSLAPQDRVDPTWVDGVVRGVAAAAQEFGAGPALGGDTVASRASFGLGITVLGAGIDDGPPLLRRGARVGDRVQVSGDCGWAALYVLRLREGDAQGIAALPERAREAWLRPRPRLDLLPALAGATAGIDISDGLVADAEHLAAASGVRLVLDREACVPLPLRDTVGAALAERLALCGGEDYELLVTAAEPLPGFEVVGRVEAGRGLAWADDSPFDSLALRGWDHGRAE